MDVTGDELIDLASRTMDSFKAFDGDKNGTIETKELKYVLQHVSPTLWDNDKVDALFDCMDQNHDEHVEYHEFIHWICGAGTAENLMLSRVLKLEDEKKAEIKRKAKEERAAKLQAMADERAEESRKYRAEQEAKKEKERLAREAEEEEARKIREAKEAAEAAELQKRIDASKAEARVLEAQWEESRKQFDAIVSENQGQWQILPKDVTKATAFLRKLQKSEEPAKLLHDVFPVPLVSATDSGGTPVLTETTLVLESGVLIMHNKSNGLAAIQEDGSLKVSAPYHYQAKGKITKITFEGDIWTINAKGNVLSTGEDGKYMLQKDVAFVQEFVNYSKGIPVDEAAMSLWCSCKETIGQEFLREEVNGDNDPTKSPGLTADDCFVKMRVPKYPFAR